MSDPRRAVVFVHGAGGGGWEWDAWARVFAAEGWRVFAPDLQPAADGLAATRLADYRAQVADGLARARREADRVALVGASLGGLLVLLEGAQADARVLVNPMPPAGLPADPSPAVIPWRRRASLAGTRRAIPEADDAAALLAFQRWRDESGAVMDAARAGVALPASRAPTLVMASRDDTDVPFEASAALAGSLGAAFLPLAGSHVAPLLGRDAPAVAALAAQWLETPVGGTSVPMLLGERHRD
ncbi:alpha/beta fold hydrolase [Arenimonas sp.]|uniref:alpha/beta fold hydrolase n=1 Tax=Arenimonas sp. TaxID=1872635 RepID=UPI002E2EB99B|nr:alpha/beta fold hydrolase [Arenimonas sp.]HEX4853286.1 alpha/beta fold hydrolase [Arenimonas sp.]